MRKILAAILLSTFCLTLPSCMESDNNYDKYASWRKQNDEFINSRLNEKRPDGTLKYMKIVPRWAPNVLVLLEWHNDTSLTSKNLRPLDNSTISVKYEGMLIDSTKFDSSYSRADSAYVTRPINNILGWRAALPYIHVGDSVTMLIASGAAYGSYGTSNIKPYSTLIFNLKLKEIIDLERP